MDSSLRPHFQTMLILLMLCPLILGVSVQRIASSEASHVLQELATNTCTIIVCSSAEARMQAQELQNPAESTGERESEIKELQGQLENLKASIINITKVLLLPDGVMVGEKIFKSDRNRGNFDTAEATCSDWGGTLASPRNPAENSAVQRIVELANAKALLGISDMATEGKFEYLNGESIQYSNWAPGEPNNAGNEDCVDIHSDGRWHDTNCGIHDKLIVCEFKI